MKVKLDNLRTSTFSESIYSHEPPADLIESIRQNGVLQAIWIDADNTIISGHRRVGACRVLGIKEVPAEMREYSHNLVIEANRYRTKTCEEKLNEAHALEKIVAAKAKKQQGMRTDLPQISAGSLQPLETRKEVAEAVGISHDTLAKLEVIKQEEPEAMKEIDAGNRTVSSVYNHILQARQRKERVANKAIPLPKGKYRTIVVDPPWPVDKPIREVRPNQNVFDYPTMTIQEIECFPLGDIMDDAGCHVYLWTTQKFLRGAFEILRHWELTHIFTMVWHKPGGFQPFGLPQYNCEFILFGRKGNMGFETTKAFPVCFSAKRGGHSEKPEEFYEIVRRVSPQPRIDVFGRSPRKGFDKYGK